MHCARLDYRCQAEESFYNIHSQVDRLHIKHPGGEQFYEMADLENDKITINIEETESIDGRVHYSHQEENDWSPWVSSDSPVS